MGTLVVVSFLFILLSCSVLIFHDLSSPGHYILLYSSNNQQWINGSSVEVRNLSFSLPFFYFVFDVLVPFVTLFNFGKDLSKGLFSILNSDREARD
jgi:hypothetical protein